MSNRLLAALILIPMTVVMSCEDDASTSSNAANVEGADSASDPNPTSLTSPDTALGGSQAAAGADAAAAGTGASVPISTRAGNGAVAGGAAPSDPGSAGADGGGGGGRADASGMAGAPAAGASAPLGAQPNGELCSANGDCASGNCVLSGDGQNRCFGLGGANDECSAVFDCNGGLCLPDDLDGQASVCVPDFGDCAQLTEDCQLATVMICQFIQSCGDDVTSDVPQEYRTDFNYCVATECKGNALTAEECLDVQDFIVSGEAPCP